MAFRKGESGYGLGHIFLRPWCGNLGETQALLALAMVRLAICTLDNLGADRDLSGWGYIASSNWAGALIDGDPKDTKEEEMFKLKMASVVFALAASAAMANSPLLSFVENVSDKQFGRPTAVSDDAATPHDPTAFSIRSITSTATGGSLEDFTVNPYVWGTTNFIDSVPNDGLPGFFNIEVNSGPSTRVGFDYEITFDYSAYDIGFFGAGGPHSLDILNIKPQGSAAPIINVVAKDAQGLPIGLVATDGSSIFFDTTAGAVLAGGEIVTIQFSQVPEPGTLSMLVLGGLALIRRRR